jgi:peptidoglycan/xylan/chitin deacetylase (PgdA/CDA1 family)
MYHQVTPDPHPAFRRYSVTPKAFGRQMGWLARRRYVSINFDALLECRAGQRQLPRRAVIITFDDGFAECAAHAAPLLERHGFVAVFYLVAGVVGGTSRWLRTELGAEFPMMDWATARRLEDAGMRCAAHSLTHPRLAALSPADCRHELARSRQVLEARLGHPVLDLAYPFGSYNATVRSLAAETGYRTACTVNRALSAREDDPLALSRVGIYDRDSLADFACKVRTARSVGELARGARRRLVRWLRRVGRAGTS